MTRTELETQSKEISTLANDIISFLDVVGKDPTVTTFALEMVLMGFIVALSPSREDARIGLGHFKTSMDSIFNAQLDRKFPKAR